MGVDRGIMSAMQDHKQKIAGPHFLMSADNPKFPDKNQAKLTHPQVLNHLKGAGYDAHEVQGHYGAPERSIVIYGVSPDHAEHLHGLASRLGQDSSIYSTGKDHEMRFHHGEDAGKKVKGTGTQWHAQKPGDFYTTLPGGVDHFTHNFEFGKAEEEQPKALKLVHYSHQGGLKQIDPKFQGSGVDSRAKGRESWHPHSFFYEHGTEPESIVTGQSQHKYHTSAHPDKIYDLGKDPHGHVRQAYEEHASGTGGMPAKELVHEKIKAAGFHGFRNSASSLPNVVAMYHPMKVEGHERTR